LYLKARMAVVSNSAETILKLVMNSPDIIGLLPHPAVPPNLTILPVTLPSLTLDVHLEARKPPILSPPSSAGFSATNFRHEDSLKTPVLQI
jgi:hypothetical protein